MRGVLNKISVCTELNHYRVARIENGVITRLNLIDDLRRPISKSNCVLNCVIRFRCVVGYRTRNSADQ